MQTINKQEIFKDVNQGIKEISELRTQPNTKEQIMTTFAKILPKAQELNYSRYAWDVTNETNEYLNTLKSKLQ